MVPFGQFWPYTFTFWPIDRLGLRIVAVGWAGPVGTVAKAGVTPPTSMIRATTAVATEFLSRCFTVNLSRAGQIRRP